jgi:hypothetical protein
MEWMCEYLSLPPFLSTMTILTLEGSNILTQMLLVFTLCNKLILSFTPKSESCNFPLGLGISRGKKYRQNLSLSHLIFFGNLA